MVNYPDWLEKWWTGYARDIPPLQLEKRIRELSDSYTIDRSRSFPNFDSRPDLIPAYGLFFFPQTFSRVQFPLLEAVQRGLARENVSLLDLGSGMGAAALGASTVLQVNHAKCIDQSRSALDILKKLRPEWSTQAADFRQLNAWSDEQYDLILISFALNEAFKSETPTAIYSWITKLMTRLNPGGLLLILEPALRESSEQLEKIRNLIASENRFFIWGPCLHHQDCPLLRAGKFWCHEVRQWRVPQSLSFLNRHLYREIAVLKFSFLMIGKEPAFPVEQTEEIFRLISPITKLKGKYVAKGCAADGLEHEYFWLKRGLNEEMKHRMNEFERGDILRFQDRQPVNLWSGTNMLE
ncbi:MAG: hypothetical protein C5B54_09560 [Acidobacteria bacterium]|nr:MAG: hypothetical protein C5B54_09560 [Acidobacteriota bacterium]